MFVIKNRRLLSCRYRITREFGREWPNQVGYPPPYHVIKSVDIGVILSEKKKYSDVDRHFLHIGFALLACFFTLVLLLGTISHVSRGEKLLNKLVGQNICGKPVSWHNIYASKYVFVFIFHLRV